MEVFNFCYSLFTQFYHEKKEHIIGFQPYCPPYVDYYNNSGNVVLGLWRDENIPECVTRLNRVRSNLAATIAMKQQDAIAAYFTNQGRIPWQ